MLKNLKRVLEDEKQTDVVLEGIVKASSNPVRDLMMNNEDAVLADDMSDAEIEKLLNLIPAEEKISDHDVTKLVEDEDEK